MSFTFPTEAQIVKGYLESNGIRTFIKDEMTAQINNFYSNAIGGVKILVNESDYDKGIQLLKDGGFLTDTNTTKSPKIEIVKYSKPDNTTICPFCKSKNISRKKYPNILIVPFYFILGFLLPIYKLTHKCFDCEKEWRFKKS